MQRAEEHLLSDGFQSLVLRLPGSPVNCTFRPRASGAGGDRASAVLICSRSAHRTPVARTQSHVSQALFMDV